MSPNRPEEMTPNETNRLDDWSDWSAKSTTRQVTLPDTIDLSDVELDDDDSGSFDADLDLDLDDAEYYARLDRRHDADKPQPLAVPINSTQPVNSKQRDNSKPSVDSKPSAVKASADSKRPAVVGAPPKKKRRRRNAARALMALATVLVLIVGFVVFRLNQIQRIDDLDSLDLDRPGVPAVTQPFTGDVVDPNQPVTTLSLTTSLVPVSSLAGGPAPIVTIPGEGSCEEDPACAAAPVVNLPEAEKPKPNRLLVTQLDVEPIGGVTAENTLIIGTDSRANVDAEQTDTFGEVGGKRSDTIMLLRIDKKGEEAAILSFPRDLFVNIAETGKNDRINSAYAGSTKRLVKTIQQNFGVPINHVVEVDFSGFQSVVGTLGGVNFCFENPVRDPKTGLAQEAGCRILDPVQSMSLVRSRKLEEFKSGKWVTDPRGDLGRVLRQQEFIRQVMQRAIDAGGRNPVTANALITDLTKAIRIDGTYSTLDLIGLANLFRGFEPSSLQAFTVDSKPARVDGKAVLLVNREPASEKVALFGKR